ncbi:MAG TPA: copper resistance protein CopC, partial [Chloroflexota bacterium]|nr:copper resistance protein CopC [Chloroflexota bacterium]
MIAAVWFVSLPIQAEAHAFLVETSPAQGERLSGSPASLQLQFTESVAGSSVVDLRTAGGRRIGLPPPHTSHGGLVIQVKLPTLQPGIYLVSWQVVSADDGHLTAGEFAFAVATASGSMPSPSHDYVASATWPSIVYHAVFILGLLGGFGGLLAERFLRGGTEVADAWPPCPSMWLVAPALAGAVGQLGWLVSTLNHSPTLIQVLQQRQAVIAIVELAAVAYALWLLLVSRTRRLAVVPLAVAVGAAALAGHPGSLNPLWAPVADLVHLVAISLWVGGLGYVVLVGFRARDLLPGVVARYSRIAIWAVIATVLSGILLAVAELLTPSDLLTTPYGNLLLIKVVIVAAALVGAGSARRRIGSQIIVGEERKISAIVRTEAATLVVIVVVGAILANFPAPAGDRPAADLLGTPLPADGSYEAGLAGNLAVYLAA